MPELHIRYDILTQNALRSVVQTVLADAAENGLPGEHHFFITFDTRVEGVGLSDRLRTEFPTEIKIVLNHQFWDLKVNERGFEVGVAFSGIPERLVIPFVAITRFEDRYAGFDVHFFRDEDEAAAPVAKSVPRRNRPSASSQSPNQVPTQPPTQAPPTVADPAAAAAKPAIAPGDGPSTGGEVVRFDRFRKK